MAAIYGSVLSAKFHKDVQQDACAACLPSLRLSLPPLTQSQFTQGTQSASLIQRGVNMQAYCKYYLSSGIGFLHSKPRPDQTQDTISSSTSPRVSRRNSSTTKHHLPTIQYQHRNLIMTTNLTPGIA